MYLVATLVNNASLSSNSFKDHNILKIIPSLMISGPQNDWIFSHFQGLINLDMCSTERNISKFSLISWNTSTILPVWTHSSFILTPCYKNFISCQTSASKNMNLHFSHKCQQILYEVSGALIFSCCKTFTQVLQLVYTLSCNRP